MANMVAVLTLPLFAIGELVQYVQDRHTSSVLTLNENFAGPLLLVY